MRALLALVLLALPIAASAAEPTVRRIDSDRTIEADLVIEAGSRLVIAPGVTLRFAARAGIACSGILEAIGTAERPIVLTAVDPAVGWRNVAVVGPGAAGSRLAWCRFSHGRGRAVAGTPTLAFAGLREEPADDALIAGGGLLIAAVDDVRVEDCRFAACRAFRGGALCAWQASPIIERSGFAGNTAGEDGGAIHCVHRASPIIRGNHLSGNRAPYGGAIHCLTGSSPAIAGNAIVGNTAERSGSALSTFGTCEPTLTGNLITGNSCLKPDRGAIGAAGHSRPTLDGNCLHDNAGPRGVEPDLYVNDDDIQGQPERSAVTIVRHATRDEVTRALEAAGTLALAPEPRAGDPP